MTTAASAPPIRQGVSQAGAAAGPGSSDLLRQIREPGTALKIVLLAGAFVLLFNEFFARQHRFSWGSGDWSHAYMVPFISVFLLWQHRAALARMRPAAYWPGLVPMLLGVACYVFFLVGSATHLGQGLAVVLTLFGLVLLLLGPAAMRVCFLPIAYLVFGITIPEKIMNIITWPLQQLAAQGGYVLLSALGIDVSIVGNQITVVDGSGTAHPLNVAEACSGMRMLIGFLALGAAVALVATGQWWKRVVLLALGVPIALLMNILRVAVLGVASLYNANLAAGQAHTFIGTVLLVPGFLLYMVVVWALNRAVPEPAGSNAP